LTQWAHGLRAASAVAELADCALATIDLGGGLGVPYFDGDTALDLEALKVGINALKKQQASDARIARARVIVEPGRFLTASAGVYLMQVRVNKTSRGQRFIICDGGMHHHLAASGNLGQVIKRDYPIVAATKIGASMQGEAVVSGPLCTPLDTVGRKTNLPAMAAGDLVAILQSGAYGLTASPVGFLSHPIAKEVLIDGGRHRQI
ncbi:MAG: type III PLP-dependent enzyme, partial [Alphaproteobacteria bacterium]|nr:type III PLP-dependent enzyme [Alphaproteobacteria bacterium]